MAEFFFWNFSMSGINSGRWNRTMLNLCGIVAAILKMATGRHFSMSGINSGHHNLPTYEMSLSSKFDMWVDKWCPKLIPDIEKFLPVAFFKMAITIPNTFNIVRFQRHSAILKMATGRNFSMLGINSGHHYLPTYQILMISGNVEFLPPIFYTVFWQPFSQYRKNSTLSDIIKIWYVGR
jgi:hypothetical protein